MSQRLNIARSSLQEAMVAERRTADRRMVAATKEVDDKTLQLDKALAALQDDRCASYQQWQAVQMGSLIVSDGKHQCSALHLDLVIRFFFTHGNKVCFQGFSWPIRFSMTRGKLCKAQACNLVHTIQAAMLQDGLMNTPVPFGIVFAISCRRTSRLPI